MNEFLKYTGVGEIFRYVCPGGILLLSLGVWRNVGFSLPEVGWVGEADREWVLVAGGLIMAYVTGLVLESVNQRIFGYFMIGRYRIHEGAVESGNERRGVRFRCLLFLLGTAVPPIEKVVVERAIVLHDIENMTRNRKTDEYRTFFHSLIPYDFLEMYRTVKAQDPMLRSSSIFEQATTVHRQVRFSLGTSLAFAVVAVHTFVCGAIIVLQECERLWAGTACEQPLGSVSVLLLWVVVARLMTGQLSRVAKEKWIEEHRLTASLTVFGGNTGGSEG